MKLFFSFLLVLVSMGVLAPPSLGNHDTGNRGHHPAPSTDHPTDETSENPSNTLTAPDLLRHGIDCAVERSLLIAIASSSLQSLVALRDKAEGLQNSHADLVREHSSLHHRHQRLTGQHTELGQELAALKQAHEALLQRNDELLSAHKSSQEALRDLRAKNEYLSWKLSDAASAWRKDRQQTMAAINKFAQDTRVLVFTEKERLQQSEEKTKLIEGRLQELERENMNLKEEAEKLEKEKNSLQKELEAKKTNTQPDDANYNYIVLEEEYIVLPDEPATSHTYARTPQDLVLKDTVFTLSAVAPQTEEALEGMLELEAKKTSTQPDDADYNYIVLEEENSVPPDEPATSHTYARTPQDLVLEDTVFTL